MCGIVGVLPRSESDPSVLEGMVRRMAAAITHRGPDDDGFFATPRVALGIRRLSIIDVAGGHQPILTEDGKKVIVFNGEIYNYRALRERLEREGARFTTRTDTEVVLQAFHVWGAEGLARLEGMFGLAIWDEGTATLTLARDWLGQKSIFLAETPQGLAFASEIKALLALDGMPRAVNLEALSHYMTLRYLPGRHTLFEGIEKLPAAHRLEARAGRRDLHRGWTPAYQPKWTGSEAALIDELDGLMTDVVAEHLMSEVPLGAFLSGGIDSSLVVAYAARASDDPVQTFSVGVHDEAQSELPWARQVAGQYHTRHTETIVEPDLAAMTPPMVAALEEPVDPFAAGVYIVSEVTAKKVTVALGGDGGDELFAGYDRYIGQQIAQRYARLPAFLRKRFIRPLLGLVPESFGYKSLATKLRWLDRMADLEGVERYAESAAFLRFPHHLKSRLFEQDHWKKLESSQSERLLQELFADESAEAFVDKMLHTDCMTRLADHQLPIVDRMAMAHSLEARNPFLDRRVATFAMRIPAAWKMRKGRIKYVTRKLAERYLSRELVYRKKQGFGFPLALWLRGDLRSLIRRTAREGRLGAVGLFRKEEMSRLVDEHVEGKIDHNYRLWMLFNLELWYRHFFEGESVEDLEAWVARARTS